MSRNVAQKSCLSFQHAALPCRFQACRPPHKHMSQFLKINYKLYTHNLLLFLWKLEWYRCGPSFPVSKAHGKRDYGLQFSQFLSHIQPNWIWSTQLPSHLLLAAEQIPMIPVCTETAAARCSSAHSLQTDRLHGSAAYSAPTEHAKKQLSPSFTRTPSTPKLPFPLYPLPGPHSSLSQWHNPLLSKLPGI